LLASAFSLNACEPVPPVLLKGIVAFSTNRLALLENTTAARVWDRDLTLGEGQRSGDVEVLQINPATATVRVRTGLGVSELGFAPTPAPRKFGPANPTKGDPEQPGSLRLQNASAGTVLPLYQLLLQRTLIRPQNLSDFELNLCSEGPTATTDLISGIEQALKAQGVFTTLEGEKFVLAGGEGTAAKITPQVRQLPPALKRHSTDSRPTGEEMLPAGTINFFQTDLDQTMAIFQELTDRTLLRPSFFAAPGTISLQTHTPLTPVEATFAFNAVFAVNDISVISVDDKFLLVFPTSETNRVRRLLEQKSPTVPAPGGEPLSAGALNFRWARLPEFMAAYQRVCGQKVEVAPGLPDARFTFRNQTALTPAETLRAMDLVLGLQRLGVVNQDDGKGLRLVRLEP
jgi:hypothetical protein